MEVYLDILFLENIVINFLIIFTTSRILKKHTYIIRIFLGALAGAAYVVLLTILPGMSFFYTAFAKILLSLAIIFITFGIEKIRLFIKNLLAFYLCTFVFAGASFAFIYLSGSGGFIKNGIMFVFGRSKSSLIALSIATAAIITVSVYESVRIKLNSDEMLVNIDIIFDGRQIKTTGLIDTGNSLVDPLTGYPVIVVEFGHVRQILPDDIRNVFAFDNENDLSLLLEAINKSQWNNKFRLVPFTSLGMENGMLVGFKPDKIKLFFKQGQNETSNVVICIYTRKLTKNLKYGAIINPELLYYEG